MRDAIRRSGYLLEQRVARRLEDRGYFVETSSAYPDPSTGKSREQDISAIAGIPLSNETTDFLFINVLCECENNGQPFVIFTTDDLPHFWEDELVKCAGIPAKLIDRQDDLSNIQTELAMQSHHHYWTIPTGTQYCGFQPKRTAQGQTDWLALHLDDQHDTFTSLTNALEGEIDHHYSTYEMAHDGSREAVNLTIYYPLLVLRGDLYTCREGRRGPVLRRVRHAGYLREVWSSTHRARYMIDIVEEAYVGEYLDLIEAELARIKRQLNRRKKQVHASMERLLSEIRKNEEGRRQPLRQIIGTTGLVQPRGRQLAAGSPSVSADSAVYQAHVNDLHDFATAARTSLYRHMQGGQRFDVTQPIDTSSPFAARFRTHFPDAASAIDDWNSIAQGYDLLSRQVGALANLIQSEILPNDAQSQIATVLNTVVNGSDGATDIVWSVQNDAVYAHLQGTAHPVAKLPDTKAELERILQATWAAVSTIRDRPEVVDWIARSTAMPKLRKAVHDALEIAQTTHQLRGHCDGCPG